MTTLDHIAYKRAQILYARRGGRYVPVNDPYAYEGLREGTWLVKVQPNVTTIRQMVWPDKPEIDAALCDLEDRLVQLIGDAARARPRSMKLTPAQKRAWDKLIEVGGDQFSVLSYGSTQSIADEVVGKVRGQVKKRIGA